MQRIRELLEVVIDTIAPHTATLGMCLLAFFGGLIDPTVYADLVEIVLSLLGLGHLVR